MVRLTEDEKRLIARRAHGEYAINESCRKIWRTHSRKNRHPDDSPYLDFLRVLSKKSIDWEQYELTQCVILDLFPDPYNLKDYVRPSVDASSPVAPKTGKRSRKKRKKKKRTVEEVAIEATISDAGAPKDQTKETDDGLVQDDDGLFWLPPGWDPTDS